MNSILSKNFCEMRCDAKGDVNMRDEKKERERMFETGERNGGKKKKEQCGDLMVGKKIKTVW